MGVIQMKQLLEAGVHFGHQTRRWNPKMAEYIFTERNGIYIIDLQKTVKKIEEAYYFVRDVAAEGGSILFVGTKKQAQDAIREEAERTGMYYVNARWLGGMLTNFKTIKKRIERLYQLEKMAEDGLMKSVIESYLVSAFNITEAEKKLTLELKPYIRGEFEVTDIKKARIAEIMGEHLQEESHWYKMKLTYIILDESKGKEKKVVSNVIVKAHDIMHSIHVLEDGMRGSVSDYTITAISESSYLDIIRNVAI